MELIIVIIIVAVLATLAFSRYSRLIEKARGTEARATLGDLRKKAAAFRLEHGTVTGLVANDVHISANATDTPSACTTSNYFSYAVTSASDPSVTFTVTRCSSGGKAPNAGAPTASQTLTLTTDFSTGVDSWGGTGPWY